MKTILYIAPSKSTFIRQDVRQLEDKYIVRFSALNWHSKILLPLNFIRQFIWLMRHLGGAEACIVSFAGYHSVIPTTLGKLIGVRVFIILNGTESVRFDEYNYGLLRKWSTRLMVKWTLRNSHMILPVSKALIKSTNSYAQARPSEQGVLNHFELLHKKIMVIPNGFDIQLWNSNNRFGKRSQGFITVASVSDCTRIMVKGIDIVLELAKQMVTHSFTIVGVNQNLIKNSSENVRIVERATQNELLDLYNQHQFYLQFSISEGFGCALAEAMLCGCVPIGSNAGAIPEVIGDTGLIVPKRNTEDIEERIANFIAGLNGGSKSLAARSRILENYSIKNRIQFLSELIEKSE